MSAPKLSVHFSKQSVHFHFRLLSVHMYSLDTMFSYIISTQKEKYGVKWCSLIIRNYIHIFIEIRTIVMCLHTWKNLDIFTHIVPCNESCENVRIFKVYRDKTIDLI